MMKTSVYDQFGNELKGKKHQFHDKGPAPYGSKGYARSAPKPSRAEREAAQYRDEEKDLDGFDEL